MLGTAKVSFSAWKWSARETSPAARAVHAAASAHPHLLGARAAAHVRRKEATGLDGVAKSSGRWQANLQALIVRFGAVLPAAEEDRGIDHETAALHVHAVLESPALDVEEHDAARERRPHLALRRHRVQAATDLAQTLLQLHEQTAGHVS